MKGDARMYFIAVNVGGVCISKKYFVHFKLYVRRHDI